MHILLSRGKKCILNYLSSYLGMISYLRESLFYLAPIFAPLILLMLVKLFIPQMDLDESHFTFMIGVPIIRLFRQRNLPIMVFISSMMPRQPRQARASTSSASVDTQAPNVVERNIWISDQGKIIYTMRASQEMGVWCIFISALDCQLWETKLQDTFSCKTSPVARHFRL